MNEILKEKLISIFQDLADTVSSQPDNLSLIIDEMLKEIMNLKDTYTESEVATVAEQIAGSDSLELYWLARAGIQEVKESLKERLESDDACQAMWAAIGLVYLKSELGLNKLDRLILASNKENAELTLEEIYEELCTTQLPILVSLREKINSGY